MYTFNQLGKSMHFSPFFYPPTCYLAIWGQTEKYTPLYLWDAPNCGNEEVERLLLLAHVEQRRAQQKLPRVRVPVTPRRQHPEGEYASNIEPRY